MPTPTDRWVLPDTLVENLQLIADGVVAVAGFAVAAIRIRRDTELELVVDTGRPELRGTRIPLELMLAELELAEDWGVLRFVPHGCGSPENAGWVVPEAAFPDVPDAWHPMDMLVAPLYDADGQLRGTLAIDEPVDGMRPGPERRSVLEQFAALASRAVLASVEREALAEQVELAMTAKNIVRTTSAQLSLTGLLKSSERTLVEGFQADALWINTFTEKGRSGTIYTADGSEVDLPQGIVAFAEQSAGYCWHQQEAVVIGAGLPLPRMMTAQQFDDVVELLGGIAAASMVFVPLGAGLECMGSLVLTRREERRQWTGVECASLLDIGHDLGRAALNARTFDREHTLVTELQALDTYKSQLIATVSHELTNPLTAVAGHLEMLESDLEGADEQVQGSLAAIGRASERMRRVVENLLMLRRVGDPTEQVPSDPVDLSAMVAEAVELVSVSAETKKLILEVDLPEQPVIAAGEGEELDTVVLNLLSNAVKYTPEGGSVRITLRSVSGAVVLTVADDGIGISAEDQAQLFTEFFRSTNPVAVVEPGTGLGLVIVKRIVERHHGTIEVRSSRGAGSTFTVKLPAAEITAI